MVGARPLESADVVIDPVLDIDWLAVHRADVVLADVRWYLGGPPGGEAYARGHIPGAVFVGLDSVLSAPAGPDTGRHPLPEPVRFAAAMEEVGIGDRDTVIAYDDEGGVIASRLVWMLRSLGSEAALLDGGIAAWTGPLQSGREARPRARFVPRPWPSDLIAPIEEVATLDGREVLIDARDRSRYAGAEPDPIDPRSGHIPGAHSLPARENTRPDGLTLSPQELRERFAAVGAIPGAGVVVYCGSGVSACHDLLMLERAGLAPGRLYVGSWSQWSRDQARPIATGLDG